MKKSIIIMIIVACIIAVVMGVVLVLVSKNKNGKEEIYSTKYYFALGSRTVKIYDNGEVYDDLEIENPEHEESYKYLKKLSDNELDSLKDKLKTTSNNEELKNYVIKLVYGVEKFENNGNY